jgi:hypothetical protein
MRQWDQIKVVASPFDSKHATNDGFEIGTINKLDDREPSDRNNETRAQDLKLLIHPARAVANFVGRWHSVSARTVFAWKAATNGGEINFRANFRFSQAAELFKPLKKRSPGRPRERFLQNRFPWPGRLADQHHVTDNRSARYRRRLHSRTPPALPQPCDMLDQETSSRSSRHLRTSQALCTGQFCYRRNNDNINVRTTLMMMQVTMGK